MQARLRSVGLTFLAVPAKVQNYILSRIPELGDTLIEYCITDDYSVEFDFGKKLVRSVEPVHELFDADRQKGGYRDDSGIHGRQKILYPAELGHPTFQSADKSLEFGASAWVHTEKKWLTLQ